MQVSSLPVAQAFYEQQAVHRRPWVLPSDNTPSKYRRSAGRQFVGKELYHFHSIDQLGNVKTTD